MYVAAYVWRRLLFRTTFIAITGSMGKTTAKECLAAALGSRYPTGKSVANQNDYSGVPRSLLRVRPWHRFAVLEVAANGLGLVQRSARLLRPDIAIVLLVARNHMKNFRTLENVAAEKAALLARLQPNGIAILNGDDPHVAAMAGSLRQRIVWFGSAPWCDYWGDAESSKWPERFSFDVHAEDEHARVQTQLVGNHWKPSVLAAIAAALECGVELSDAVAAIGRVEPALARMQPAPLPSGAIFIRDDLDSSIDVFKPAFAALADADAGRKILIMTDVTESPTKRRDRYRRMGLDIARTFDAAVFIGEAAEYGVHGAVAAGMYPGQAHAFSSQQQAEEFLKAELKPDDLVLLKGRCVDHIARLYYALAGSIQCRRERCGKRILCDLCPELGALTPPRPAAKPRG